MPASVIYVTGYYTLISCAINWPGSFLQLDSKGLIFLSMLGEKDSISHLSEHPFYFKTRLELHLSHFFTTKNFSNINLLHSS